MDRKKRLDMLVSEAFDRPEAERRGFLEDACKGEPDLLAEALIFFDLEKDLGDFIEEPAFAALENQHPAETLLDRPPGKKEPAPAVDPHLATTVGLLAAEAESPDGPDDPDLAAPSRRRLGVYEIVGKAGSGGMGQVLIGEDRKLGRRVAIKTLLPKIAKKPGLLKRFEREARALATLNHPNIVTIHSIEEEGDIRFLTMELVDGKTLKEAIPEAGLALADLLRIATELSDALMAAHSRGVIHRDLKPNNIMITSDGRAKILDFGIAKVSGFDLTRPQKGLLFGTVPYMAPEQFQGQGDSRADLFSFGIMLFMMATGEHPFPCSSPFQRATAIQQDEPQPLDELRPGLPESLHRIIARCLEKDPDERYQDTARLRSDLADLEENQLADRVFESRADQPALIRRSRLTLAAAAATALAVVALIIALVWVGRGPPPPPGATVLPPQINLAVLPFHNLTADPATDWLRTGITELLVTNVMQSPQLKVLGSGHVHRILKELGAADQADLSPEMLRKVAEAGEDAALVQGNYAWLGEVLRITFSIAHPVTGDLIDSDSLEGRGQASLFSLVDQISATVLECFHASRPGIGPSRIADATTNSLLAWQSYSEAQILYVRKSKPDEALARLEQALRVDPYFALAAADAARIHLSLGHISESQEYSQRAFKLVDRLPLRRRFDIEAGYYGSRWATCGRAIEHYQLALTTYPLAHAWGNNLARRLAFFERYAESIERYRRLIGPGHDFWGSFSGLANVYAALGDFETGYQLLVDFSKSQPRSWRGHFALAWHLTEWGKFEDAANAFDLVAELRPGGYQVPYGSWRLEVMREQWPEAEQAARQLLTFDDSFSQWRGHMAVAQNALYRGQSEEALQALDEAIAGSTKADRALARCFAAELLLALGESELALRQAELAQTEGIEQWPELRGYYLAALAEQARGQSAAADALRETLRERWLRQVNAVEERQLHHLTGLLALASGDIQTGRQKLEQAAALLPARGVEFHWHVFPVHVPIWNDLGAAELAAGRAQQALGWLQRVTESGSEHLEQPVPFIRAFYLMGVAQSLLGNHDKARQSFERFLGYWGSGDIDRDAVAAAQAFVTAEETPPPAPPFLPPWPEAGI